MKAAVTVPVTVKCRLGIDDQDPDEALGCFCQRGQGGRRRRADRACAQGLAQRPVAEGEPRSSATRLCARFPAESGVSAPRSFSTAASPPSSGTCRAWRLGRRDDGPCGISGAVAVAGCRSAVFGEPAPFSANDGRMALIPYIERELDRACGSCHYPPCTRPVPRGPGARAFRRHLATEAVKPGASASVMADAMALVVDRRRRFGAHRRPSLSMLALRIHWKFLGEKSGSFCQPAICSRSILVLYLRLVT